MNFSDKELKQIEQLASLFIPVSDIAVVLDVHPELLRSEIAVKGSKAYTAYRRGKISTKLEIRKQETLLAKVGSPLALDNMQKALLDMEDDE